MWGYVADPLVFVVNKEVWESWTPADREIVRQAAIDAGRQQIGIARAGPDRRPTCRWSRACSRSASP